MEQRILKYFFSGLLFLLVSFSVQAQNEQKKTNKKADTGLKYPLFNGIFISADLYGLGASALGSDFISSEVAVEVDLKNRFMPIVEVGYGSTDTWDEKGIYYKSSAPYFRIGMNYNFQFKKDSRYYLLGGFRYAFSSFTYDVSNLTATDPIWGTEIGNPNITDPIWGGSVPYNYPGQKGSMHWVEFLVGVRVQVYKNLYMGWSIRYKSRMQQSISDYGDPWYVPGFGQYDKSKFGLSYTISYKIPGWK